MNEVARKIVLEGFGKTFEIGFAFDKEEVDQNSAHNREDGCHDGPDLDPLDGTRGAIHTTL